MTRVEVRLYATLQKYQPDLAVGEASYITLHDGVRLRDLLDELKIPREEVVILMVNGRREEEDHLLQDGDRIGIFPLIGGG